MCSQYAGCVDASLILNRSVGLSNFYNEVCVENVEINDNFHKNPYHNTTNYIFCDNTLKEGSSVPNNRHGPRLWQMELKIIVKIVSAFYVVLFIV